MLQATHSVEAEPVRGQSVRATPALDRATGLAAWLLSLALGGFLLWEALSPYAGR